MVALLLVLALSGESSVVYEKAEVQLSSAPSNPICKEVWEILWEYQQYTELSDKDIRELAGSCVEWAEEQEV